MNIEELRIQAEKVIAVTKTLEEAFPYGHFEEQRILVIMAGLQDSYVAGVMQGETNVKRG